MSSIPTTYNGIRFRSRLEAKWAYYFDRIFWKWEYEPYDLDGWIPDFVVENGRDKELLVECKPFLRRNVEACAKIEKGMSDRDCDILLCGGGLTRTTISGQEILGIGWLYTDKKWHTTAIINTDPYKWIVVPAKDFLPWQEENEFAWAGARTIIIYWNDATNAMQWKAPR